MGAEESVPIPPPPPGFEYFVVGLSKGKYQKIVAIFGSERDRSMIREGICQHLSLGIHIESETTKFEHAHSFKFDGSPFTKGITATPQLSSSVRKMMAQILLNLNNSGWKLKVSSELSRESDLTSLFFCRNSEKVPRPINQPLMCLALISTDKLLIVSAPENIKALIKDIIVSNWKKGIQDEQNVENDLEIKMFGNPWKSYEDQTILARVLLAKIFSALAEKHWHFHCRVNMQGVGDSIFFKYDEEENPFSNQHFVITFNEGDKIRLVNHPQDVIPVVQNVVSSNWPKGIKKEKDHHGSWEFKLSGYPWWGRGKDYVVPRYVVCKIFEDLQKKGWRVKSSLDLYRGTRDKSILMMSPTNDTYPSPVICLSFGEKDKIRLINAPQELVGICRDVLKSKWVKGINAESNLKSSCTAYEFKLNGSAWQGGGALSLHIRSVLCYVIQEFEARGWMFLVSSDVCASYDSNDSGDECPEDVQSWWFTKSQDS